MAQIPGTTLKCWQPTRSRFPLTLLALLLVSSVPAARAATLGVTSATATPGATVSLFVQIDAVPLTLAGGFSLDLDLAFDGTALSVREVLPGDLGAVAFFYTVSPVSAGASAPVQLSLTSAFLDGLANPAPPGGGNLFEVVFEVAATAPTGAQPVSLTLLDSGPALGPSVFGTGLVTVAAVPIPALLWPTAFAVMVLTAGFGSRSHARRAR